MIHLRISSHVRASLAKISKGEVTKTICHTLDNMLYTGQKSSQSLSDATRQSAEAILPKIYQGESFLIVTKTV